MFTFLVLVNSCSLKPLHEWNRKNESLYEYHILMKMQFLFRKSGYLSKKYPLSQLQNRFQISCPNYLYSCNRRWCSYRQHWVVFEPSKFVSIIIIVKPIETLKELTISCYRSTRCSSCVIAKVSSNSFIYRFIKKYTRGKSSLGIT